MIKINGNSLALKDVILVSRFFEPVELDEKSIKAINKSKKYRVYIKNTGGLSKGVYLVKVEMRDDF